MRKRLQSSDSFYESLSDITMATLGIFVIFFVINVIFVNKDTIEKSVENEKFKKESAEVSSILEKTKLEDLERLQEITDENDKKIKELTEQLSVDGGKFFAGNKSAGTRARKTAQELKALLQQLRTEILEEKKK